MKTLSNNKGVALIILIIAMTLISLLGAGMVSFMGAKQKSYPFQVNSYRALNIANAGVEYAIRFASDGLDSNGNSIFFSDATLTTIGKSFGGGSFSFNYAYATNILTVTGTYSSSSSRQIRLSNFRRYISPVTLVPLASSRPYRSGYDTIVPTISNNESNFTVNRIDVTIPATGGNTYLDILRDGTSVFNYSSTYYDQCLSTPAPTCRDQDSINGIYIAGGGTIQFDLSPPVHTPDTLYTYTLHFSPAAAPTGQYTMKIYTSLPSGNPFTIQFTL
jgi:hypothetical protein